MLRVRNSIRRLTAASASDDEGSASLEFIVVGVILLVPIAYLIIALASIQSAALGVDSAARLMARSVSLSSSQGDAEDAAARVLTAVAAEYDLDPSAVETSLHCAGGGAVCPAAGATVIVTVRTSVPLPLVPDVLGWSQAASVPVESTAVQKMSRLWGTGG